MKKILILGVGLLTLLFTSPLIAKSIDSFNERAKQIVPKDVANVILIELTTDVKGFRNIKGISNYNGNDGYLDNNKLPVQRYVEKSRNTLNEIYDTAKTLSKAENSDKNAKALVRPLFRSTQSAPVIYDCIIVYRTGISATTLDHELGHCLSPLLDDYEKINQLTMNSLYLTELFAELASATSTFYTDGNIDYIKNRVVEIDRKAGSNVYQLAKPGLKGIAAYLKQYGTKHKALSTNQQIKHMIEHYYRVFEFNGVWTGQGTQGNGDNWSIKLTINNGRYNIEYPSLECGGNLKIMTGDLKTLEFEEVITFGKNKCLNNGKVVIKDKTFSKPTKHDGETVQVQYIYDKDGIKRYSATASLTRQ
jgi:hypothetical protein